MKKVQTVAPLLPLLAVTATAAFLSPPSSSSMVGRTRCWRNSCSPIRMFVEEEAGVTAPLGFWDPLGFSADGDAAKFRKYRAMETKHGRIAQLAALHFLVTYFFKIPGSLGDVPIEDIPAGLGAVKAVPQAGWGQILLLASALEVLAPQKADKIAGDVQPDTPLFKKLEDKSDDEALALLNKEINNGRLAMIAVTGMLVGNLLAGGLEHPFDTLLSKLG